MWVTLAIALINMLGPILMKWFEAWLQQKLTAKALTMDAKPMMFDDVSSVKDKQLKLLDAVADDLWAWQWLKKNCVAKVRAHVAGGTVKDAVKAGTLIG